MRRSCPALLISAPASGQGKTTITCGLARLFSRRGMRVRVFKCGPDFIDPYWLELASGHSVFPLDLWMTGEQDCRARLCKAAAESDIILIEGVMGLYDGAPSSAELAQHFGIPILAVIDASSMAGTFGALAHGLKTYEHNLRWAGVFANRVASFGHAQMLEMAIRDKEDYLGAMFKKEALSMPERHLGLVIASELVDADQRLNALADELESTVVAKMSLSDFDRWRVEFSDGDIPKSTPQLLIGKKIAVAKDEAFCFIYSANIDALEQMGAEIIYFSPLHDRFIPECDAIWFPGGYPELHLNTLKQNLSMQASVKERVGRNTPIWAECGGMMVFFKEIISIDGEHHPMWNVLDGTVYMQKNLGGLGAQSLSFEDGLIRGHAFHYSVCRTVIPVQQYALKKVGGVSGEAMYAFGSVRASYFHAWFPSNMTASARLFLPHGEGSLNEG